jgi:hypothetical protein
VQSEPGQGVGADLPEAAPPRVFSTRAAALSVDEIEATFGLSAGVDDFSE